MNASEATQGNIDTNIRKEDVSYGNSEIGTPPIPCSDNNSKKSITPSCDYSNDIAQIKAKLIEQTQDIERLKMRINELTYDKEQIFKRIKKLQDNYEVINGSNPKDKGHLCYG